MKIKLIEKRVEAHDTKSFFWVPSEPVSYYPGQYFYFTLPYLNYSDDRGATRHFTISSSPAETRLLRFTTRMRKSSGYKKTLDELPLGTEIECKGPNGTFYFDEKDYNPHIFLAGGIGATTFRSMINFNLISNFNVPMYLLYSDSYEEDFIFGKEFADWDKIYENFLMRKVTTSQAGRIDEQKIKDFTEECKNHTLNPLDLTKCSWWVCGPPSFDDSINAVLANMGIREDLIRSEKFTGY